MEKLSEREKVMLGLTLVGATVAGVVIYKQHGTINKTLLDRTKLLKDNQARNEQIQFIKFLVIEGDIVPKARQNGENKLARKESKIQGIIDAMVKRPGDKSLAASLAKHEAEVDILRYQLNKAVNLEELIKNDENIYAK